MLAFTVRWISLVEKRALIYIFESTGINLGLTKAGSEISYVTVENFKFFRLHEKNFNIYLRACFYRGVDQLDRKISFDIYN